MPTKSVKKSAKKSAPGVPFAKGGDPRQGRGPAKGAPNAGRPPNWLREKCDALLADPTAWAQVEKILKNSEHAAFAQMWRTISERAHGKPMQPVEHNVGDTLEAVLTRMMGQ